MIILKNDKYNNLIDLISKEMMKRKMHSNLEEAKEHAKKIVNQHLKEEKNELMTKKQALKHSNKFGSGAAKRKKLKNPKDKFDVVMHEYGKGTLYSGSGKKVTNIKEALAIAFSESGQSIKKSLVFMKAKKMPIGTISEYNGKKYKKVSEGKWEQVNETKKDNIDLNDIVEKIKKIREQKSGKSTAERAGEAVIGQMSGENVEQLSQRTASEFDKLNEKQKDSFNDMKKKYSIEKFKIEKTKNGSIIAWDSKNKSGSFKITNNGEIQTPRIGKEKMMGTTEKRKYNQLRDSYNQAKKKGNKHSANELMTKIDNMEKKYKLNFSNREKIRKSFIDKIKLFFKK